MLLLVLVALCAFVQGTELVRVGGRTEAPEGWKKTDIDPKSRVVTFLIALKQQNLEKLNSLYEDRTNPDSPNYREWMTIDAIQKIVSPPLAVQVSVMNWLKKYDINELTNFGDAIEAKGTVEQIQNLLNCKFFIFDHEDLGQVASIWGDYSIPKDVSDLIEMVVGVNTFPEKNLVRVKRTPQTEESKKRGIWDAYVNVVPQTLYNMYSIPSNSRVKTNSSQSVIEWEQQYYSPTDLSGFSTNMAVNNITTPIVVGTNFPTSPQIEATLDIQYIAATGLGAQNWFWIEAGTTWLYGFATHFMNTHTVPMVASMSYGWNEEAQCMNGIGSAECSALGVNSTGYVLRVNTEFQKIGLRGVSLFAASGDSGANGRTDESCSDNVFHPAFPGASPYVTTVGATQITDAEFDLTNPPPVCANGGWESFWWCGSSGIETAVSFSQAEFASGGGFSNVAPTQSWQQEAVQAFFNSPNGQQTPASYYNRNGRGFPDMSALGSAILIWSAGTYSPVGGTSASTPIVAGIFALLNDYAISKTGKPLGPVNPLIYKMAKAHPAAFTDVTVGDNTCTESGCTGCKGYYCGAGWDPVTGLGTPNYSEMLKYLQSVL